MQGQDQDEANRYAEIERRPLLWEPSMSRLRIEVSLQVVHPAVERRACRRDLEPQYDFVAQMLTLDVVAPQHSTSHDFGTVSEAHTSCL